MKPARVFISYSRGDDPEFVRKLHDDLLARARAEGNRPLRLFYDKRNMPSRGRSFLLEIRDFIGDPETERVLLVVGPKAVQSPYVQAEWRAALQRCVIVIPLLRFGRVVHNKPRDSRSVDEEDYGTIPQEVRETRAHAIDFREKRGVLPAREYKDAFEELWRILAEPASLAPLAPDVPDLPGNFVARRECLETLDRMVLTDADQPVTVEGEQRFIILCGMGGIGKSTIAASFSRACKTRRSFKDGIAWVRMGPRPALPDDLIDVFGTPAAERNKRGGLRDMSCLIVLDDVTDPNHVTRFKNALGESGRLLITTRNATVAAAMNARQFDVGLLTETESRNLLADWSGCQASDLPPAALAALRECGRLPLAVSMIGAMMKGKPRGRWDIVLSDLREANLDEIRHRFPNYDHPDLLRALQLSVDRLEGQNEDDSQWARKVQARRRYLDLAIFPGNVPIPFSTVEKYWASDGVTAPLAVKLMDLFVARNLASRSEAGRIVLHDLQRDYLVSEQRQVLPSLNKRFLGEVRPQGGWQRADDDGYLLDHLAQHLRDAGLGQELNALVSRPWMERRLAASGSHHGFSDDVETAIAHNQANGVEDLSLLFRNCFVIGTIATLATEAPPSFFGALAAIGQVDKAIHQASLMTSTSSRLYALSEVGTVLIEQGGHITARRVVEQILDEAQALVKMDDPQNHALRILCLAWAARSLAELQLTANAAGAADHALSLLHRKIEANVRVKVLDNVARAFLHLGRKGDARRLARQALSAAQRPVSVELLRDSALLLLEVGDTQNCATAIRRIQYKGKVPPELDAAEALIVIAENLYKAGDKSRAVPLAESVRKVIPRLARRDDRALLFSSAALTFGRMGERKKAEALAKRALTECRQGGPSLRTVLHNVGTLALTLGQRARAAQLAQRGVKSILPMSERDDLSSVGAFAELLAQAGRRDPARVLVEASLTASWKIQNPWENRDTAAIIAEALIRVGKVDQGLVQLQALSPKFGARGRAQQRIAGGLAESGFWDAAESLARQTDGHYRSGALCDVAVILARNGARKRASSLAGEIENGWTRARALCDTVALEDESSVSEAREVARAVGNPQALGLLAERLAAEKATASARAIAREALSSAVTFQRNTHSFASAIGDLTPAFLLTSDDSSLHLASTLLHSISDSEYRAEGRLRMALALAQAGQGRKARSIVRQELPSVEKLVGRDVPRATMIAAVALTLLHAGAPAEAARQARCALVELAATGGAWNSDYDKDLAWARAASVVAQTGHIEQAFAAGEVGFQDVARFYADRGRHGLVGLRSLLARARLESDAAHRAHALARVARGMQKLNEIAEARTIAVEALAAARHAGRTSILDVVETAADVFASVDSGETLSRIGAIIREIESWWLPRDVAR